jgi:transposase-like protein
MKQTYQITNHLDSRSLAKFLAKEGQLLLPMVGLIEQAQTAVDEVIDVMGRATIEAVLLMSAEKVAGPKQRGKHRPDSDISWHGSQRGKVTLRERKLAVEKPRLRRRGKGKDGEVEVPAYDALRGNDRLADRMLEILMNGVSTRRYEDVLPEMAGQVGISKSSVSRETIEAGARVLESLAERRFDDLDILIVYVDGIQLGRYHVICAVGVDAEGHKHVLGVREGATENAEVATALLTDLVDRGLRTDRRRLFVIDGSKALRKAIDTVFGADTPVQRCRNHKIRNVRSHLPRDMQKQTVAVMRAAFKLEADEGKRKIEAHAAWLENDWPSAAESLREGLFELFTINRLGLPATLRRCLGTTNIIDSAHSAFRQRTARVTNWSSGSMALRWTAAAMEATSKSYRRILGYHQLWILKAHLDDADEPAGDKVERKVG